jgi:hypothetical protein
MWRLVTLFKGEVDTGKRQKNLVLNWSQFLEYSCRYSLCRTVGTTLVSVFVCVLISDISFYLIHFKVRFHVDYLYLFIFKAFLETLRKAAT